ncbi:MAG TPA: acyl-CoA dehydrogenase family protein, partial [Pseudomonadota bacterium]|nr:acyl-CoA dehydrogenase family protein [Pseudomonadota bacterium]
SAWGILAGLGLLAVSARRVVDRAVQLGGGQALERGHVLELLYRDVRALRIYEGTSEVQKLIIARHLLR